MPQNDDKNKRLEKRAAALKDNMRRRKEKAKEQKDTKRNDSPKDTSDQ